MAELEPDKIFTDALESNDTVAAVEASNPFPPYRPRKVYAGMWGPPEIGAVAAGFLAVLMALVAYFFWVVPSNNLLVKNKAEADRLESELATAKTKYGEITNTETQVAKIVESIDDFEARFLPATSTGQSALYQRLNGLIGAYGLVNTTGPDYVPLEQSDTNAAGQSEEEKGRSKYRSIYPGVYATMTLEGSYQNLRRFIREIETGREFIVVSAVELAPTDSDKRKDQNAADPSRQPAANPINPAGLVDPRGFPGAPQPLSPQAQPRTSAKQQGKTHGETVSLHIELAAYFRRPGTAPAATAQ
ncbi:MAG: hypothetical protein ABL999_00805 [Pyrinomonadaceae bacterium]